MGRGYRGTSTLIHSYTGNDLSGTTLTDTTGTEDGTSANVTTETWGADKLLVFNGTSSELTFVNEIYPEVDFSISLWMAHPNSIVEHEIIVVVMGQTIQPPPTRIHSGSTQRAT